MGDTMTTPCAALASSQPKPSEGHAFVSTGNFIPTEAGEGEVCEKCGRFPWDHEPKPSEDDERVAREVNRQILTYTKEHDEHNFKLILQALATTRAAAVEAQREHIEALERERDAWAETARQHCNNEFFYRDLVREIGELFGVAAKTSDDGSIQQDVLALKVPELVRAAILSSDGERG